MQTEVLVTLLSCGTNEDCIAVSRGGTWDRLSEPRVLSMLKKPWKTEAIQVRVKYSCSFEEQSDLTWDQCERGARKWSSSSRWTHSAGYSPSGKSGNTQQWLQEGTAIASKPWRRQAVVLCWSLPREVWLQMRGSQLRERRTEQGSAVNSIVTNAHPTSFLQPIYSPWFFFNLPFTFPVYFISSLTLVVYFLGQCFPNGFSACLSPKPLSFLACYPLSVFFLPILLILLFCGCIFTHLFSFLLQAFIGQDLV